MITGTEDTVPINSTTAADRVRPYDALATGHKYLLVFDGANHAAFSGNWRQRPHAAPAPRVVSSVQRATGLFWRAHLADDAVARDQLADFGSELSGDDRFSTK